MSIIITLLIAMLLIVGLKFLFDWMKVPQPFNWILLLLFAIVLIWYLLKHPITI